MPCRVTASGMIEHKCDICGAHAYFGFRVSLRKALNEAKKGNVNLAKEFLGKWYCGEHKEHGNKT